MKKRGATRAMLGFTQNEMAILLNVSRSQWAMYESNSRNLPSEANACLNEMIIYMLSPEAKDVNNLPKTDNEDTKTKQLLEKRLRECEFQLMVLTRKITKTQKKLEQFERAVQQLHFLNQTAESKKIIRPDALKILTERTHKNFKDTKSEWDVLQIDLELLKGQQEILQKVLQQFEKVK